MKPARPEQIHDTHEHDYIALCVSNLKKYKRMKEYLILACLVVPYKCAGQALTSQYFQNLPAYSPAFTGANNFLDIRTAFRKQWTGFERSPQTAFISAYGAILPNHNPYKKTSRETGDREVYENNKLGVGGYVFQHDQSPLSQSEAMFNLAVHVCVSEHSYLALGTSSGISNSRIDMDEITVLDPNDPTYQSYLRNGSSNTFFNFNGSLGLYSPHYFMSYGMMQLINALISGNEQVNNERVSVRHNVLAGFRLYAGEKIELLSNIFYRFDKNRPDFVDVGLRLRYNGNLAAGIAYRSEDTYIMMLGFTVSDLMILGYSYEFLMSDSNAFNHSSHEIVLGVRLFNDFNSILIW
ncbi:MAG: PorP/SprF family type IX secretion system membrane protein [Cytophagales bacterium]|nr:PorP/SprF family type IX secretion system membrane protein [Cytophagales bacterium]